MAAGWAEWLTPPPVRQPFFSHTMKGNVAKKGPVGARIWPHKIGVFVRSEDEMERAFRAVHAAGMYAVALDEGSDATPGSMAVGTMHLAKGLDSRSADPAEKREPCKFRAAAVVARDRDHLLVTGVQPVSEFLDDLRRNL